MASLKDVAKLAAVSLMTVSRAINNPERLRPDTLARVQQAIDQLHYVPDFSARKIRDRQSVPPAIGVLALDTATTPFSVELLLSLEKTAQQHGWTTFVINLFEHQDAQQAVDKLLSLRPAGIVFTTMGLRRITLPARLRDKPLVLANCLSDDAPVASYVPDDVDGQYQATRALIARGYRRPLCIHLPVCTLAGRRRRAGFEQAWREAGLPLPAQQYHLALGDNHYLDTVSLLAAHLPQGRPDFDVLVCGNDRVAFVAYQYLLGQGIRIPADVAVLGYDNMVGIGELFYPALTTVQLPHLAIGREAALHIIEQRPHREVCALPSPLLARASVGVKHTA
ncbi:LacI family DNA-binding transcriptional regulator [Pantoea sp. 1.19]|uniref:LacI family DNA-binding transcriptional regulator n=1 Tax=Pantoea sp. 1.19 TaxID=1925589 RepID=UPI000948E466|nr:LacI family DNA-binding transcriptional regulator [Pantoea sp. 1.19]